MLSTHSVLVEKLIYGKRTALLSVSISFSLAMAVVAAQRNPTCSSSYACAAADMSGVLPFLCMQVSQSSHTQLHERWHHFSMHIMNHAIHGPNSAPCCLLVVQGSTRHCQDSHVDSWHRPSFPTKVSPFRRGLVVSMSPRCHHSKKRHETSPVNGTSRDTT